MPLEPAFRRSCSFLPFRSCIAGPEFPHPFHFPLFSFFTRSAVFPPLPSLLVFRLVLVCCKWGQLSALAGLVCRHFLVVLAYLFLGAEFFEKHHRVVLRAIAHILRMLLVFVL